MSNKIYYYETTYSFDRLWTYYIATLPLLNFLYIKKVMIRIENSSSDVHAGDASVSSSSKIKN